MSARELKPCPFCGTSLEDDTHPGSTVEGCGFTFECGKCGANWPRMTREAMDGLDDEGIASFFNSRSDLRAAGYLILSPDEVRGIRDEALEEAAEHGDAWDNPSSLRLAAGEMTAQELRTARAVARGIAAAIRSLKGGRDAQ